MGARTGHVKSHVWLDGNSTCSASVHLAPADPLSSPVEDVDAAAAILSKSYICAMVTLLRLTAISNSACAYNLPQYHDPEVLAASCTG